MPATRRACAVANKFFGTLITNPTVEEAKREFWKGCALRLLKSDIMSERAKALLLMIIAYLSFDVQCREPLSDFLDFQDRAAQIFLTKTCTDHLGILRKAIEENQVWALKGNESR